MGWLIPPPWLPDRRAAGAVDRDPRAAYPERRSSTRPTMSSFPRPSSKVTASTLSRKSSRCRPRRRRGWGRGISSRPATDSTAPTARWSRSTETRCSGSPLRVSRDTVSQTVVGRHRRAHRPRRGRRHARLPARRDEPRGDMGLLSRATSTPNTRERHGHPTIFVNTMHTAGFVDRIATGWAGPYSRVVRRKVSLLGSFYAGDSMVGRGRVVDKRVDTAVTSCDSSWTSRSPSTTNATNCAARPN